MGCNFPLHAFDTGFLTDKGKPLYKIVGRDVEWIYQPQGPGSKLVYKDKKITNYKEIPCGKCIGCRLSYSKEWANRCLLESKGWANNYFITLTYAPEKLPLNQELGNATLQPKDLQDFMKRLRIEWQRKHEHENVRFFGCGEYGTKTHRPHYHIIAFNLPLFDLEELKKTNNGDTLYYSKELEKIWGNGNVWVGEVNWNTCAYVARYIMKKQKGPTAKDWYEQSGESPEFVRMSRRPGIAWQYFQDNKDEIYKYDEIRIEKRKKGKKFENFRNNLEYVKESIKPCRYYDNLYDMEDHEFMEALKKSREERAKANIEMIMSKTSLTRNEYLEEKERRLKESIKALKRNIE